MGTFSIVPALSFYRSRPFAPGESFYCSAGQALAEGESLIVGTTALEASLAVFGVFPSEVDTGSREENTTKQGIIWSLSGSI
jgi:hypothetical protein